MKYALNLIILICAYAPCLAHSTILPEDLPVFKNEQDLEIDESLKNWFNTYASEKVFTRIEDINSVFTEEDKISAFYALLLNPELTKNHHMLPHYQDVEFELIEYLDLNNAFHPLHDYILENISSSKLYNDSIRKKAMSFWNKRNNKSCPRRNEIANRLELIKRPLRQKYYVKKLISELEQYQDRYFKMKTYRSFIKQSNKKDLKKMSKILYPSFKSYKSLETYNQKYFGSGNTTTLSNYKMRLKTYRRKGWCNTAKKTLRSMAKDHKKLDLDLQDLIVFGRTVAKCYHRRKNIDTYANGWDKVANVLTPIFGDDAYILAKNQKARVYWSVDDFVKSKAVIAELIANFGTGAKKSDSLASTHLMLAQIYDNEKRPDDAIANFETYLKIFPEADQYDAYKSLVILYTEKGAWEKVMHYSENMINRQNALPQADRDVSKLGFGLFWGGRAALKLSKFNIARDYWKRLAVEFYSTYYGALGHYLLETIEGKSLSLQPSVNVPFNEGNILYDPFTDLAAEKIDRIKLLLLLGQKKSASCEIKEIEEEVVESIERGKVAKALLYHAAGNWDQAVRIYGSVPRTLRKVQPSGMEKILFPVKYKDDISKLSKKLDLDPYFVISLIRQESLFNPKAYSPAGAIGLMQMLRTTARLEAKRLSSEYVSNKKEKKRLLRKTRSKWKLFDEDTNLKLGIHHLYSLLKKHGSSVFTLSAYNAGPGRLKVWKDKYNTDDLLLFTEKIPFKETRSYVKLILRNYFYYKKWYGGKGVSMPHLSRVISPVLGKVNESFDKGLSNLENSNRSL